MSEYVPDEQSAHDVAPVVETYLPATHDVQMDEPLAPDEVEYVPAPQLTQVVDPVDGWNLPAAQNMHPEAVAAE